MTEDKLIELILDTKDELKLDKKNETSLSMDFYNLLNKFIKFHKLYERSGRRMKKKGEHFSDEEVKSITFQVTKKCPRCKKYPAQIDFSGKVKPCFNCESKELEEEFII